MTEPEAVAEVAEESVVAEAEPEAVEVEAVVEAEAEPEIVAAPEPEPEPEAAVEAEPEVVVAPEAVVAEEPAPVTVTAGWVKPDLVAGKPIAAYSAEELVALVGWLDSDGEKRSDDELLRAAMKELGFARLGPRIKEALGAAVATVRA